MLNHERIVNWKVEGYVINSLGKTIIKSTEAIDRHVIEFKGQIATSENAPITGRILGLEEEHQTTELPPVKEHDEEFRDKIERKYLTKKHTKKSDIFRFMGDVTIEPDEIIRGEVVTLRGTIEVKGEVIGGVVAVFWNVELDSTAYVHEDVVSVGGRI